LGLIGGGGSKAASRLDETLIYLRDAELALNSCITLRPSFPRGYELRGRALILQALRHRKIDPPVPPPEEATAAVREANTEDLSDAQQLEARGMADFDRARTLAPYDPDVYWARAHTMELLGRQEEAVTAYRTAMQLDRPMGRLTGQQWVYMAENYLSTVCETSSDKLFADACGALALAHLLLSQTDDPRQATEHQSVALEAANRALATLETESCARAVRGTIHLRRGNSQAALEEFGTILDREPDNFLAAAGRAQALEQLKDFARAKEAWIHVAERCARTDWQSQDARAGLDRLKDRPN
jgi:Tfp pilus assembly protein PilF